MSDSILTTTKRTLGLAEDYTVFDQEIIVHINSTLATLHQLGVGPAEGMYITDATSTWSQFLQGDPTLNAAKSYIYICVRLLFDATAMAGPVLTAFKQQKEEFESRLMYAADPYNPTQIPDDEDLVVIDPGGP